MITSRMFGEGLRTTALAFASMGIGRWVSCVGLGLLLLPVQPAAGQAQEMSIIGEMTTNIGDALNAARSAREHMNAFNDEIGTARRRYQECGGTCTDQAQIEANFDRLLTAKDFYYAVMRFSSAAARQIGAGAQADLLAGVLGGADGGMPGAASFTHRHWTDCLARETPQGLLSVTLIPKAFPACAHRYREHKQRRDLHEYYEQPGRRAPLRDPDAPAVGAPLSKEERRTLRSKVSWPLPAGVDGQQVLHCEYGPLSTESDDLSLYPDGYGWITYDFWYGAVPITRTDLEAYLKRTAAAWPRWRRITDRRRRYLAIPEFTLATCPPGDINADVIFTEGLSN